MRHFTANQNDAGQRLDKYLSKLLAMPESLMYKNLRTGHIKVNKKKKAGNYRLCVGDEISLYINEEFFKPTSKIFVPFQQTLDIVYETDDLLIVNKEKGIKSQPDIHGEASLADFVKAYLADSGAYRPQEEASFSPALCNRLDRNTAGLVIAAKNAPTLRILNEKIKCREIKKLYQCIVCSQPPKKSDLLTGYILKDRETNISRVIPSPEAGALFVKTGYRLLKTNGRYSLLEVELYTGRSHQIRAHLASIGCPIAGDFKYGGGRGTQNLCAYKLCFGCFDEGSPLSYLSKKIVEIHPIFDIEV